MSIRLTCPHCGVRPLEEWTYGEVFRVPDSIADPDARDVDRAYMHNNPQGPVREAWFHLYGCRRWVYMTRDTATDQFL